MIAHVLASHPGWRVALAVIEGLCGVYLMLKWVWFDADRVADGRWPETPETLMLTLVVALAVMCATILVVLRTLTGLWIWE